MSALDDRLGARCSAELIALVEAHGHTSAAVRALLIIGLAASGIDTRSLLTEAATAAGRLHAGPVRSTLLALMSGQPLEICSTNVQHFTPAPAVPGAAADEYEFDV